MTDFVRREYDQEAWLRLGKAVKRARQRKGFGKTNDWVHATGKSDKTLLGLERGEPRGDDTLSAIEDVLEWPRGRTYRILDGHDFHALPDGRVVETAAAHVVVFDTETDQVIGDISDSGMPWVSKPDGIAWRDVTDHDLARFVELASYELLRRHPPRADDEQTPEAWEMVNAADRARRRAEELGRLAAYRTEAPSSRARLDAVQDEAAEAPDAPGSEHGA